MKWYLYVAAACFGLLGNAVVAGPAPSYWLGVIYAAIAVWLVRLAVKLP